MKRNIDSGELSALADKHVMASFPWPEFQGSAEVSLWDDPTPIIEQTLEYRAGFGGAPPWPAEFVVIGDEEDACPYALNCNSCRIIQADHGNLKKTPLQEFDGIKELVCELRKTHDCIVRKPWWKIW